MSDLARPLARLSASLALLVALLALGCDRTAAGLTDAATEPRTLDALTDSALDASDAALDATKDAASDTSDDLFDARSEPRNFFEDVLTVETGADPFGECTVPRPDVPDAAPPCAPDSTSACACTTGPAGTRTCLEDRTWSACQCSVTDRDSGPIIEPVPTGVYTPIPEIPGPRLIAPQSGSRVTTLRPTLRWRLPDGVTRARVELCADRPCDHLLVTRDTTGTSWRPTDALAHGVVFWRVRGLSASGAVTWTSATWEFGVPRRDTPVDTSYGVLKDFNGDGYDDVVAESGTNRDVGGIRVFTGGPVGISGARARVLNPPEQPTWNTERIAIGGFGRAFAISDLNGDGLPDIVAGADLYRELPLDPLNPQTDGRAYVFFGSRRCVAALSEVSYRPTERGRPFKFGWDVGAGDFNGDGYGDLLATSRDHGGVVGAMRLYLGGPSGPAEAPVSVASVGARTAQFVGDLNGDGYADIMARACNYETRGLGDHALVVLYGNPEGRLEFHAQYIGLPFRSDLYNWIMQWSDINEDGYADAVVSFDGLVQVYYGAASGVLVSRQLITPPDTGGGSGGPSFGIGLSMPADVDGDGHAELLAGAEAANSYVGQVYLFPSRMGELALMWSEAISGSTASHQGFSIPGIVGDIDGDGFNDVAIGAPSSSSGAVPRMYVYSGRMGPWWETPRLVILGLLSRNIL